ncbi:Fe(3+) dicitrate ABC transporter substrate-binding protein [Neisseria dentiae]|uniref:Fe(3+) dicitrate ABC transporter substrate-binding protein n=1 Tax=Neisseria dentiae TaxID=194197 RepID=UPI0035A023EF
MKPMFKTLAFSILVSCSFSALAVTVTDAKGQFTINTVPKKVVVLELSFVDALSQVGVSPVGVADDKDKNRILPQVRSKVQPWKSVGMRSQPSLEAISQLKPDLIIADLDRNNAIYTELKKIAPTLMLDARYNTYQNELANAQTIATVLGKGSQMKVRIQKHNALMAQTAKALAVPKGTKVVYGNSRETSFNMYSDKVFTGGVLQALGFTLPAVNTKDGIAEVGLEQVAAQKPEWLFIAHYRNESLAKKWMNQALWKAIPAVKNNRVVSVSPDVWARARGITAAEQIAADVRRSMKK